jgi:hypothetical protein
LPAIGQPAHSHFIPVITPIVLTRISLSVTYLYHVSAAAYRVAKSSTYQYNIRVIVSCLSVYKYDLNPLLPVGPTRLYFHAVLNTLPNLPTTERSTLTANKVVDAETVNRTMSTIIGTVQTSLTLTSNATTALQRYYFTRFVSDTLTNVTSITAQTWTYNFSTNNQSLSSRFPVNGTNQPVRVTAYVWRPGTSSKVGDIVDGNSASTVDVSNAAQKAHITTFTGNQVLGVQAGDVLCFEVWFEMTQATASSWIDPFFYDGPTVTTVNNTTVSNHASFIQTPQGLSFGAALVRVSKSSIQKYDIIHRTLSSKSYRYNVTALASLAPIYRYNIATRTTLSQVYNYSLGGRLSKPSVSKYNILITKTAPKIFRYALNSTLQTSRVYKYNIANIVPTVSRIYRYNLTNAATLSQVYKYQIYKAVQLSRVYRYSLISRAAQTRVYKYQITTHITNPKIYRYAVAVRLSLSRLYKYSLLTTLLSSRTYKYNLVSRLTASRIYRYVIASKVTLSRIYKYNLTSLAHVVASSVYKYNLLTRLSLPSIYQYYLLQRVTKKAIVFDGVDDAIALGNNSALNNLENFTITCWVYPTANSSGSTPSIVVKRYPSNNGFLLYFSTNNFTVNWRTVNNSAVNVVSTSNYIDLNGASKWYHIAVTFNRATGSQQLLINAVIRDSDTNTGLTANQVGSTDNMSINGGSVHWAGRIRDFRLFRSELSQAEINKIYVDDPTAPTPNYWLKMEEGVGTTTKDAISGTFTGTLQNGANWLTYESGLLRKYLYSLTTAVPTLSRIYRYPILSALSLSRVYKYSLLSKVLQSRIYKYNLLKTLQLTRKYLYNLVPLVQKQQSYLYSLLARTIAARIYRYRLGDAGLSVSKTYLYNLKARVRMQSKYLYSIATLPSGVLWQLTGKDTDFPDSLENLVADFIKENWSITDPAIGANPAITTVLSRQHQTQVDNFAYDNFRSYYIRVKEVASEVKNRQVRLNTYEFSTPVELEAYSRRLKKGEAYPELNAMMNELLRIFGTYQQNGIFGVQGITLERISSMEKERPPAKSTWARRLTIILHYYKVSVVG